MRIVAIALTIALLAGGCGGSEEADVRIGLQRIALDLAFRSEDDAPKAEPRQTLVATVVPSQAEFAVSVPAATFDEPGTSDEPATLTPRQPLPLRPLEPTCPAAVGVLPERPVTNTVLAPPVAGRYKVHRVGTFAVESALFPFRGLMPPEGEKEYRNIKVIPGTTDVLGNKAADQYEYEVYEETGGNFTTRSLRVTPTAIQLVKQVTKIGETTVTFSPIPAITLVALGSGENASWNSAGVDTATGTSMVVQGRIAKRENVDLCGKVYDTYKVQSTERVTNVTDQYTSQTDDANNQAGGGGEAGKPNIYWVATQYGGLFIQEEFHTRTTLTARVGGAPVPVTLELDYTNTFDAIDPAGPARAA